MNATVTKITPKMAEKWLAESNFSNRSLRLGAVERLSRDMASGKWKLNGETIKFDTYGRLIDGQHRLSACVEAGVSFDSLVVREVPGDCYTTVDNGLSKKFSDHLSPNGVLNSAMVAGVARWLCLWKDGNLRKFRTIAPTVGEMEEALETNSTVMDSTTWTATHGRINGIPPSLIALVHYVSGVYGDREKYERFIEALRTGEGLFVNDPEYQLREWIQSAKKQEKRTKEYIMAMFLKAWKMAQEGRKLRRMGTLRFRADEEFPELRWPGMVVPRKKKIALKSQAA